MPSGNWPSLHASEPPKEKGNEHPSKPDCDAGPKRQKRFLQYAWMDGAERSVRLLAPQLDHGDHTKDIDFSQAGIRQRWAASYAHTKAVLAREPWAGELDPLSGVILHEASGLTALAAE